MISIDEFINSLYKGVSGEEKEITEFKEEMKVHLVETVNELKHEGKTDEESLKIAYERFGDSKIINNGIFKLFNKQKKFIRFILIAAIAFILIGVTSYIIMSQMDLKFQKEQKILTEGVLNIIGDDNSISEDKKSKIEDIVKKHNYINYIALFKVDNNPKLQKLIAENDNMSVYGTYNYPFDIKMAEVVYPNVKPITNSPNSYDRSTVIAANKKWAVQYEYKKFIYSYVENYSSRIVYSNMNYSTATFNYKNSIYLIIIIGGTLLAIWMVIRIYKRLNSRLFN